MYCSVPIGLTGVEGRQQYLRCGKKATHEVKNSDWCICSDHVAYAEEEGWPLIELKGE